MLLKVERRDKILQTMLHYKSFYMVGNQGRLGAKLFNYVY